MEATVVSRRAATPIRAPATPIRAPTLRRRMVTPEEATRPTVRRRLISPEREHGEPSSPSRCLEKKLSSPFFTSSPPPRPTRWQDAMVTPPPPRRTQWQAAVVTPPPPSKKGCLEVFQWPAGRPSFGHYCYAGTPSPKLTASANRIATMITSSSTITAAPDNTNNKRKKSSTDELVTKRSLMYKPVLPRIVTVAPRAGEFVAFMRRREALRIKKDAGEAWPWTHDITLQKYKFTNVKREDDRVTRWLRQEWTSANADAPAGVVLLNCVIFRSFGTVALARELGWSDEWRPKETVAAAVRVWTSRRHAYTRAYSRRRHNSERRTSEPPMYAYELTVQRISDFVEALPALIALIDNRCDFQGLIAGLRRVKGLGGTGFMAKEVLHDALGWTSISEKVRDPDDWTPIGPGARRGLNRLLDRPCDFGILAPASSECESHFVQEILLLLEEARRSDGPWTRGLHLNIHDVQFQLCEFDKYERVRLKSRGASATVAKYRPLACHNTLGLVLECRPEHLEWDLLRTNEQDELLPLTTTTTT